MIKDDFNTYDEFESWEDDYELLNSQQYEKLVAFRETIVKKHPDSLQAILDLCEAYCLNKDYQKSLEKLSMIYSDNADVEAVKYQIIDSLRGLGRNYKDFNWIEQPTIFKLDEETCVTCFDIVKGKRRGMSVMDLELALYYLGYVEFKADELVKFLSADSRFQVTIEGHPLSAIIKKKTKR